MSEDRTLSGSDDTESTPFGNPNGRTVPDLKGPALETVLDLNEVMTQARLVETVAYIYLRGDLKAEDDELLEELATLVDAEGRLLNEDDDTLGVSRAQEIMARRAQIRETMLASRRAVRFRAMPDDEYQSWMKAQQDSKGDLKDADQSNTELIARCAVAPKMTVVEVEGLRKKLGAPQIAALSNKAYAACTTGGVDIPKLPHFSPSQRRDSSGRN